MQPLVHLALGALLGYAAAAADDAGPRRARAAVLASASWASVPDWHLVLSAAGLDGLARPWRAYHDSTFADVHWLHRTIDANETTLYALEDGVAVVVLVGVAIALARRRSDGTGGD